MTAEGAVLEIPTARVFQPLLGDRALHAAMQFRVPRTRGFFFPFVLI